MQYAGEGVHQEGVSGSQGRVKGQNWVPWSMAHVGVKASKYKGVVSKYKMSITSSGGVRKDQPPKMIFGYAALTRDRASPNNVFIDIV